MSLLITFAAALLLWASGLAPTGSAAPWGHWQGTISAQFGTLTIELDLATGADGKPAATFTVPERQLTGLPIMSVSVDGNTVAFESSAIGVRFKGDISADGRQLDGTIEAPSGSLPLTLTRTGDAHIVAPPRNAAVDRQLEGAWSGTLDVDSGKRLTLTLQNRPDGTAAATMVSVDEGGLAVPVSIVQEGKSVKIQIPAVSSAFAGTLSADGQQLTGTYTTNQGLELPLTLQRRARSDERKE